MIRLRTPPIKEIEIKDWVKHLTRYPDAYFIGKSPERAGSDTYKAFERIRNERKQNNTE